MNTSLRELLGRRAVVLDGAMATVLFARGLEIGGSAEHFMLKQAEVVAEVHREYRSAGADIITTNTFGVSCGRFDDFEVQKICSLAVDLAKSAGEGFIAGSIGPSGGKDADIFALQARMLETAGADLLILETMTDIREARIAFDAVRDASGLPIIVSFAFAENGETYGNATVEDCVSSVADFCPLAIGANCGGDPESMIAAIERIRQVWDGLIIAAPSAGNAEEVGGKLVWKATPRRMAEIALRLVRAGAGIVGSCCGTSPEHTRAIAEAVRKMGE
ncbi:MAG TPA: hypothetical protein ENN07_02070 [candidate division Zixibacteria bacterium]|nr:hypothetical protein [candidate division Zixibacteria bacterium]